MKYTSKYTKKLLQEYIKIQKPKLAINNDAQKRGYGSITASSKKATGIKNDAANKLYDKINTVNKNDIIDKLRFIRHTDGIYAHKEGKQIRLQDFLKNDVSEVDKIKEEMKKNNFRGNVVQYITGHKV